jgi:hypothetical protein
MPFLEPLEGTGVGALLVRVLELPNPLGREPGSPDQQVLVRSQLPGREHLALPIQSPGIGPTDLVALPWFPRLFHQKNGAANRATPSTAMTTL